jgi:hypothetical protein
MTQAQAQGTDIGVGGASPDLALFGAQGLIAVSRDVEALGLLRDLAQSGAR